MGSLGPTQSGMTSGLVIPAIREWRARWSRPAQERPPRADARAAGKLEENRVFDPTHSVDVEDFVLTSHPSTGPVVLRATAIQEGSASSDTSEVPDLDPVNPDDLAWPLAISTQSVDPFNRFHARAGLAQDRVFVRDKASVLSGYYKKMLPARPGESDNALAMGTAPKWKRKFFGGGSVVE